MSRRSPSKRLIPTGHLWGQPRATDDDSRARGIPGGNQAGRSAAEVDDGRRPPPRAAVPVGGSPSAPPRGPRSPAAPCAPGGYGRFARWRRFVAPSPPTSRALWLFVASCSPRWSRCCSSSAGRREWLAEPARVRGDRHGRRLPSVTSLGWSTCLRRDRGRVGLGRLPVLRLPRRRGGRARLRRRGRHGGAGAHTGAETAGGAHSGCYPGRRRAARGPDHRHLARPDATRRRPSRSAACSHLAVALGSTSRRASTRADPAWPSAAPRRSSSRASGPRWLLRGADALRGLLAHLLSRRGRARRRAEAGRRRRGRVEAEGLSQSHPACRPSHTKLPANRDPARPSPARPPRRCSASRSSRHLPADPARR